MTIDIDELESLGKDYIEKSGQAHSYQEYQEARQAFVHTASPDVVIELIRRVREAEEDAAKYKWLMADGPLTFKEIMQFMGSAPAHCIDWRVQMDMRAEQAYAALTTAKEQTK